MSLNRRGNSVADLGGARDAPSSGPKFLHFHAVFGKNWCPPPRCWRPTSEILDSPLKLYVFEWFFMLLRLEWSKEVLDLCVEFRNDGVVAIDIAGDERLANPTHELHIKTFQVSLLCTTSCHQFCLERYPS